MKTWIGDTKRSVWDAQLKNTLLDSLLHAKTLTTLLPFMMANNVHISNVSNVNESTCWYLKTNLDFEESIKLYFKSDEVGTAEHWST